MIEMKEKSNCCGCTACVSICPRGCISMVPDEEGFLYPLVDSESCLGCRLCEKRCPEKIGYVKWPIQKAFTVRHKNTEYVESSTSGGAFTAFAEYTIDNDGAVFGAGYDSGFHIAHLEIESDKNKLAVFRGSKYVQSDLGCTYQRIKELLRRGKFILFSGTPCQVAGLNNYLGSSHEKLLTIEVICHGTPSPMLWQKYLEYQVERFESIPIDISFRKKTYGYHSSTMEIVFENGRRYTGSARVDYMLKSFFAEISSRPSCYTCMCKGLKRAADISIFDCWHVSELIPGKSDDDKGYTNVLINTQKGIQIFQAVSDQFVGGEVDIMKAITLDGVMVCKSPKAHNNRNDFYQSINREGIQVAVRQYIPISRRDLLLEKSKGFWYRTGLLKWIKIIKR